MKPDKIVCRNCGKQIDRGTWCSDKCRMAFKRKPEQKAEHEQPEHEQKPEQTQPEQPESEQPEQNLRDTLSKTDKTFYDRAMKEWGEPYYKFSEVKRTVVCAQCGGKFTTSLSLNRYCSYGHYRESLGVL